MWWKIYFIILSLFAFISVRDYLSNLNWTIYDVISLINTVISEIGAFAFAFKKNYFSVRFWKYAFWTILGLDIGYLLYAFTPLKQFEVMRLLFNSSTYPVEESPMTDPLFYVIISILLLFTVPAFYMLYRLGYPKDSKASKTS